MSRARRLGGEFLWVSLGQTLAAIGAIVGVRVLTEFLSPEQYGQLALGLTVATFVNVVLLGPINNAATRFYSSAVEAGAVKNYLSALFYMVKRISGYIVLVSVILVIVILVQGGRPWIGMFVAAVLYALLAGFVAIFDGIQNAARHRSIVALHQGVATWGRFTVAAGMILIMGASSFAALVGYGLAMLIILASEMLFFRRTILPSGDSVGLLSAPIDTWQKNMYSHAWPFAAWGLLAWANAVSGRWSLEFFGTTQAVGYYAVLFQLGYYPVTIMASLVNQLAKPILFQRAADASDLSSIADVYRQTWLLISAGLALTVLISGAAALKHQLIFSLLVSQEYRSISWLLPGSLLAAGFYASSQICTTAIHAHLKTKSLVVPKNVAHLIGLSLSAIGAAWYGLVGVIIASIVFSVIHFAWILSLSISDFLNVKSELNKVS